MRNRKDSHQVVLRSVDEAVGITQKNVAPGLCFVAGPSGGRGGDLFEGVVEVQQKTLFRRVAPLPLPVKSFFDLAGGFRMEDQPATGHGGGASISP